MVSGKLEKRREELAEDEQRLDTREPRFPGAALWKLLGVDQDDAGGTKGPPGTTHSPLEREAHPRVQ